MKFKVASNIFQVLAEGWLNIVRISECGIFRNNSEECGITRMQHIMTSDNNVRNLSCENSEHVDLLRLGSINLKLEPNNGLIEIFCGKKSGS